MPTTQRHRHTIGHRMKLHVRVRDFAGHVLRILTPRPGTDLRIATNRYHETWHVLSDLRGAKMLAHLMWGLSYQRRPGTVALVDAPFVVANPFDARSSDPVLVVPTHLTAIRRPVMRRLAGSRRWLGRSDRTMRLQSWGLDAEEGASPVHGPLDETFRREEGMLVLRASPDGLRSLARRFVEATRRIWYGQAVCYFAEDFDHGCHPDGELQLFDDFRLRLSDARVVRRQIGTPRSEEDLRKTWALTEALQNRRESRGYRRS